MARVFGGQRQVSRFILTLLPSGHNVPPTQSSGIKVLSVSSPGTFPCSILSSTWTRGSLSMRLLTQTLCLFLALSCAVSDHHVGEAPDRCEGIEFNAITANEQGIPYFFKEDHLWKGFHGAAEFNNGSFKELDDHHHLGHVDAAFRLHSEDHEHHDHIIFFLDDKVFSYYNHTLEDGFPKDIQDVFPGVPSQLDAAVECPKSECGKDSVIFFKGDDVYHYDIKEKTVEEKEWAHLPNCTSAFRWLEHYYCFHGHDFTKFHPVTGVVIGKYPKDAREYFMRCSKFGDSTDHAERERCSRVHLDAVTADDGGSMYVFRGHHFLHRDNLADDWEGFTIESAFKELHSEVDAAFSYKDDIYMIKDQLVYAHKEEKGYPMLEGYPKSLKDVLGIEDHVDAAFVCGGRDSVYVILDKSMHEIDMSKSPPEVGEAVPLPIDHVDAAVCGPSDLKILRGSHYYEYESPMVFAASKLLPEQHKISSELLGCDH
ncbi:hypothetical protein AGOR_G00217790 [Albula goreensis]|uniref:Hemopexin n=1 Tax=Albula goreensis TaxID=1534307 RepID=A0A8T3CL94_9TELE|nr:hypothetical protein AGOR_G00217790 [Albula goreensis]